MPPKHLPLISITFISITLLYFTV